MNTRELSIMAFILACLAIALLAANSFVLVVRVRQYENVIAIYESQPRIEIIIPGTPVPLPMPETGEG